jgi:hypothetical protein
MLLDPFVMVATQAYRHLAKSAFDPRDNKHYRQLGQMHHTQFAEPALPCFGSHSAFNETF